MTSDANEETASADALFLYLLQMNPVTLKAIYDKDGILGVTRYGAVALRRALTRVETKGNSAVVRAYRLVLDELTQNTVDKIDKIEPIND